jgi:Predicted transcriptional regulator, consists of a Zn-ribbon and ATP-cone domains
MANITRRVGYNPVVAYFSVFSFGWIETGKGDIILSNKNQGKGTGLICPICAQTTEVQATIPLDNGATVRRRRKCLACKYQFSTWEKRYWTAEDDMSLRDGERPLSLGPDKDRNVG